MSHRICAGALIFREGKLLFVRHCREGRYDFWLPPGGGVKAGEEAAVAAAREAWEETRITVGRGRFAMVEELERREQRQCKLWFFFDHAEGEICADTEEARAEYIIEARFLSREEIKNEVFVPHILREDQFWDALAAGFPEPLYLGLREMSYW